MISYDLNLKIFTSSLLNSKNYISGFGVRQLGDGKKHINNIFRFFDSNNISYSTIVIPEQIHSTNIETVNEISREKIIKKEDTDGLITQLDKTVISVVTADCCPIIFKDEKKGIIGISHQGWRGSIKRMAQKMIKSMIKEGSNINDIKIAIGPTINDCCYSIDEDRYYQFLEEFDGYSKQIFIYRFNKWYLNLAKLNYLLLLDMGVKKENIDFFPFCTSCDKEKFFSFRRERNSSTYGQMFSFIMKN